MLWVFGFLAVHFTALGLLKWRQSDALFGAYVASALLWFFGGGLVLNLIKWATGLQHIGGL